MQQPTNSPQPSRRYDNRVLTVLSICYASFWIVLLTAGLTNDLMTHLGIGLFWGVLVSVLIMDWHGYITLQELPQWQMLTANKRTAFSILCLVLSPFLLGYYLIRTERLYRHQPLYTLAIPGRVSQRQLRPQLGMIVGAVVTLFFVTSAFGNTMGIATRNVRGLAAVSTPNATSTSLPATITPAPSPTSAPNPSPTPKPNPSPTPSPTATSAPSPTPRPNPSPTPRPNPSPTATPSLQSAPTQQPSTGINGNPWGYDFNPGYLITSPPESFCSYFSCIKNFWNGIGHVEECQDGMYSKSGGRSGSCSSHGGELRPLYAH